MRAIRPIPLAVDHPDLRVLTVIRDEVAARSGGLDELKTKFPIIVRDAIDFVLDPVNTARTRVTDLDNVEKTFIGLKLEHFVRDMLDVPKRLRDLHIAGLDVDIKNTVGGNWSIPQETYRNAEPCLLMAVDDKKYLCYLGLIVAKLPYLHKGKGNRDTKKGVSKEGFKHILWIVAGHPFPESKFDAFDMDRFRELRKMRGGKKRAAQFFRENLGTPIHRSVIQALLFDQADYMRRVRGNGGARDILRTEGIAVVSKYHNALLASLGLDRLEGDQMMAISGLTPEHAAKLIAADTIDKSDEADD